MVTEGLRSIILAQKWSQKQSRDYKKILEWGKGGMPPDTPLTVAQPYSDLTTANLMAMALHDIES